MNNRIDEKESKRMQYNFFSHISTKENSTKKCFLLTMKFTVTSINLLKRMKTRKDVRD